MNLAEFVRTYQEESFSKDDLTDLEEALFTDTGSVQHSSDLTFVAKCISAVLSDVADPLRQYKEKEYADPWIQNAAEFYKRALKRHQHLLDNVSSEEPIAQVYTQNKGHIHSYFSDLFANMYYRIHEDTEIYSSKKLVLIRHAYNNKMAAGYLLDKLGQDNIHRLYQVAGTLGKDGFFKVKQAKHLARTYFPPEDQLPSWGHRWEKAEKFCLRATPLNDKISYAHTLRRLANAKLNIARTYNPRKLIDAQHFFEAFVDFAKTIPDDHLQKRVKQAEKIIYDIAT